MPHRPSSLGFSLLLLAACPGDDGPAAGEGGNDSSTGSSPATDSTGSATSVASTTSGVDTTSADSSSGDATGSTTEGTSTGDESSGSTTGMVVEACEGTPVLLYEQVPVPGDAGAPAGTGVGGVIRSADDFEIDAADQCWCITRVVFHGNYFKALLTGDLEVGFYDDDSGVPLNPPVAVELGVPIDTAGTLDYTLATPLVLPAGTHWVSAMPALPNIRVGIWFWEGSDDLMGSPWAVESTYGPFVPDCITWTEGQTCFPPSTSDALAFEIHGVAGGDACM